jgi:hypothetical protein
MVKDWYPSWHCLISKVNGKTFVSGLKRNYMATETNTSSARPGTHQGYWRRMLRPLFWWLLLVLVLLGIHQHQVWMERTRLYCSVTMYETNAVDDATGTLDGHPISSGDNISLGSHQFTITEPKAESFTTNFFAWYGSNDFGKINLKRAMGTLNVTAEPPAKILTITGPEFLLTLSNSSGTNLSVPTDSYYVRNMPDGRTPTIIR